MEDALVSVMEGEMEEDFVLITEEDLMSIMKGEMEERVLNEALVSVVEERALDEALVSVVEEKVLEEEALLCAMCLDFLKDPVTVPCGHKYCRKCLQQNLRYLSPTADHSTREDFLQYSTPISLDPNSAHRLLSLSEGNRRVTVMRKLHRYRDHPDKFTNYTQVLSRSGLSGRCYWELDWSGAWIRVAVSYRDIQRKGVSPKCAFGFNDKSWALCLDKNQFSFWSEGVQSLLQVPGPVGSRIGVFLDHGAGVLSFYSVYEEKMRLLHRVHTSFTQPLFPGVGLDSASHRDSAQFTPLP